MLLLQVCKEIKRDDYHMQARSQAWCVALMQTIDMNASATKKGTIKERHLNEYVNDVSQVEHPYWTILCNRMFLNFCSCCGQILVA
jgi:hypothetical protein